MSSEKLRISELLDIAYPCYREHASAHRAKKHLSPTNTYCLGGSLGGCLAKLPAGSSCIIVHRTSKLFLILSGQRQIATAQKVV